MKYVFMLLVLAGCGGDNTSPQGINNSDGAQGPRGFTGHSIVAQTVSATESECPDGGIRVDLYIDIDDSLTVSKGDTYQSSIVSCNRKDRSHKHDSKEI